MATSLRLPQRQEAAGPSKTKSGSENNENETTNWKIQNNTELLPTNAFGTLEFQGSDVHTTKAEVIASSQSSALWQSFAYFWLYVLSTH